MENKIIVSSDGKLVWQGKEYLCSLGKNGISKNKEEGDGTTPAGCFLLREVLYRADRIAEPQTSLPKRRISEDDGWCDDPKDPAYNMHVRLPFSASHEKLWREDNIYDVIVPIGYNDDPPITEKGSAIFIHVARPKYTGTEGCVALALPDLLEIIGSVNPGARVCIQK